MADVELHHIKHIHFIGIGGVGMGGIAEILLHQGYQVSGSDIAQNNMTKKLQSLGVRIYLSHQAQQVAGADIVVISSAIAKNNPEVQAAIEQQIPIVRRAQMLAEIMPDDQSIAVAGTHGKTTTASLVVIELIEGGFDPTFVVGGLVKGAGSNAKLGNSEYFVAEADESDASFLYLQPKIAIVTNIDADHLETYNNNFSQLKKAFLQFLERIPDDGLAILCIDDPGVQEIAQKVNKPILTYGFDPSADIQAVGFTQRGTVSYFTICNHRAKTTLEVKLNLPGKHNVLNALAAYAVGTTLNINHAAIKTAFAKFAGVGRRFQLLGELPLKRGKALLIDDYGHHPRELLATIAAARAAWPNRRLVMVFQPHRFTRTQACWEDFIKVLASVDHLLLLDIYSANEKKVPGVDGRKFHQAIVSAANIDSIFVECIDTLPLLLETELCDGDVVLLQGAGSVGALAAQLAKTINTYV